ncbi:MAG: sodium:calcium antiporter [Thermoplasmata archaeon]|nr:MAG: sodium:calcium antiporter [Thermoplasmata archaeon]
MMDATAVNLLLFIFSVLLLYKGSDILVEGTSKTALRMGISPLVISLTIVAYGTSSPELATSSIASLQSHSSFSLGNVIGSCLANMLLVMGISSFVKPISVSIGIIRRELPILVIATILLILSSLTGYLTASTGVLFLFAFIIYLIFFVRVARKERMKVKLFEGRDGKTWKYIALIILGLISVILGAHLLVESSIYFADLFGVPEFIIAISMVAIGTSLPELAVSVTASLKGESDISLGNLLGSNVFNILLILGICSIINPIFVDQKSMLSEIFLLAVTLSLFPIFYTGRRISRIEGLLLVIIYALYLYWLKVF